MNDPRSSSSIQVIDRAAALLDAIARYQEPVSLKILSAETGLHASTAHRILASMTENRFVIKSHTGKPLIIVCSTYAENGCSVGNFEFADCRYSSVRYSFRSFRISPLLVGTA